MKGDKNNLVFPGFLTNPVDAGAALGERNVLQLRNQEPGIQSLGDEALLDLACEETSVCILAEEPVRTPLAGSVLSMAIVKKNNHSCRLWFDGKMMI
jgi:hypothetical protein